MNLQKLNPWNWFKHEESGAMGEQHIPVKKEEQASGLPVTYNNSAQSMLQLHQGVERLFDELFNSFGFPLSGIRSGTRVGGSGGLNWQGVSMLRPKLNISSDDHNYNISLEVPGLKESDISIEVKNDVLTIQGAVEAEKEDKDRHFYRIERTYGSFQRTLSLPDDANADDIKASMKEGVLNLMIQRIEVADSEVKKIPVN